VLVNRLQINKQHCFAIRASKWELKILKSFVYETLNTFEQVKTENATDICQLSSVDNQSSEDAIRISSLNAVSGNCTLTVASAQSNCSEILTHFMNTN
jgi:hypothetical protein